MVPVSHIHSIFAIIFLIFRFSSNAPPYLESSKPGYMDPERNIVTTYGECIF
jgi:hypothetical protein